MGVAIKHEESFLQDPSIRSSLVVSGIFHVSIFLLSIATFPLWMSKPADTIIPISVEVVDIADIAQTNKVAAPVEKKEEPIETPKPPVVESKPSPPPPVEEAKPDVPAPAPLEKVKPPEEKPKPVEKKPPVKSKEKVEDDKPNDINSLLKNLAPPTPKAEPQKDIKDVLAGTTTDTQDLPLGDRMTMTELGALNAQFRSCWNVLSGAQDAEKIAVELRLSIGQDRRVRSATVVNQLRYSTDSFYRAAADAAMRAVKHPKCEVLNLPPEKYNQWNDMIFNFDPNRML